jgi:hypothetical protein
LNFFWLSPILSPINNAGPLEVDLINIRRVKNRGEIITRKTNAKM